MDLTCDIKLQTADQITLRKDFFFFFFFCIEHNHFRVSPGLPAIYNNRTVQ